MNPNSHENFNWKSLIEDIEDARNDIEDGDDKFDLIISELRIKESQTPQPSYVGVKACVPEREENSYMTTKLRKGGKSRDESVGSEKPDDSFCKCPMLRATEKEPSPICESCKIWREEKPKLEIYYSLGGEHKAYTKESVDKLIEWYESRR
jgi:hypothetical protein